MGEWKMILNKQEYKLNDDGEVRDGSEQLQTQAE